jgi:hypothetical protein
MLVVCALEWRRRVNVRYRGCYCSCCQLCNSIEIDPPISADVTRNLHNLSSLLCLFRCRVRFSVVRMLPPKATISQFIGQNSFQVRNCFIVCLRLSHVYNRSIIHVHMPSFPSLFKHTLSPIQSLSRRAFIISAFAIFLRPIRLSPFIRVAALLYPFAIAATFTVMFTSPAANSTSHKPASAPSHNEVRFIVIRFTALSIDAPTTLLFFALRFHMSNIFEAGIVIACCCIVCKLHHRSTMQTILHFSFSHVCTVRFCSSGTTPLLRDSASQTTTEERAG